MNNFPWTSDRRDGSYENPVLFADYSDPDIVRTGDYYYMVSSTFNFVPGLPVLRSTDLVNWSLVANALSRIPSNRYDEVKPGCAVWAPAIRFHDGEYYIFFPMPDEGIYVIKAADPAGPWSEPRLLQEGKGLIDPCPLWDDDGKAYLVFAYAGSRAGIKSLLLVQPMAADASALLGESRVVFDGRVDHPTVEGPKFYKKDGWYYIFAPAEGVAYGRQLVLRSRSVYGSYELRVVLAQRGTEVNGPHQGALVDDVAGDWWFLHFQELQPYGRICHLQPVVWADGWPLIGEDVDAEGIGRPVASHRKPAGTSPVLSPATSDEFEDPALGLQWAFPANLRPGTYDLAARPGFLRLAAGHVAKTDLAVSPFTVSQKIPAPCFDLETAVDFEPANPASEAGLAILGLEYGALCVATAKGARVLALKRNGDTVQAVPCPSGTVRLTLRFAPGGAYRFGLRRGEAVEWIGPSFQAKEGAWIGARVGLFCLTGGPLPSADYADFDYFRFSPYLA